MKKLTFLCTFSHKFKKKNVDEMKYSIMACLFFEAYASQGGEPYSGDYI